MADEPLTPIEQSRADTGRRYYSVRKNNYNGLRTATSNALRLPKGRGGKAHTEDFFPPEEQAEESADGTVYLVSALNAPFAVPGFEQAFDHSPNITELTHAEYQDMMGSQ